MRSNGYQGGLPGGRGVEMSRSSRGVDRLMGTRSFPQNSGIFFAPPSQGGARGRGPMNRHGGQGNGA
jgi:hypothetical protein